MTITHILSFTVAAVAGTLVSEAMAFGEKQSVYKRGLDKDANWKDAWSHQLNGYLTDRLDNLVKTFAIGVGLSFILGSSFNTDAITRVILDKFGFESTTLSLSGAALSFTLLAFGRTILKKIGIIKEDKL